MASAPHNNVATEMQQPNSSPTRGEEEENTTPSDDNAPPASTVPRPNSPSATASLPTLPSTPKASLLADLLADASSPEGTPPSPGTARVAPGSLEYGIKLLPDFTTHQSVALLRRIYKTLDKANGSQSFWHVMQKWSTKFCKTKHNGENSGGVHLMFVVVSDKKLELIHSLHELARSVYPTTPELKKEWQGRIVVSPGERLSPEHLTITPHGVVSPDELFTKRAVKVPAWNTDQDAPAAYSKTGWLKAATTKTVDAHIVLPVPCLQWAKAIYEAIYVQKCTPRQFLETMAPILSSIRAGTSTDSYVYGRMKTTTLALTSTATAAGKVEGDIQLHTTADTEEIEHAIRNTLNDFLDADHGNAMHSTTTDHRL